MSQPPQTTPKTSLGHLAVHFQSVFANTYVMTSSFIFELNNCMNFVRSLAPSTRPGVVHSLLVHIEIELILTVGL